MKKVLTVTMIVLRGILMYVIVVIDRLAVSFLINIELPGLKKKPLVADENTTDEQIAQSVIDEEKHDIMYIKEYFPKARKRSLTAVTIALSYYLFTILSWTIILLIIAAIAVSIGIGILVLRIKRKTNKVEDINS